MNPEIIQQILHKFGIKYKEILPPQRGYRNQSYPVRLPDDITLNLIIYKSEPGILVKIRQANHVSNFLASKGFPTRQTTSNKIICLQAGQLKKYGCIYNYLPGHTIPWEAYTQRHLRLLGSVMATMHRALQAHDSSRYTKVADEYTNICHDMQQYFSQPNVQQALNNKLHLQLNPVIFKPLSKFIKACKHLPNQQTLHMDFVRGNILFTDPPTITGILDFEKTAHGHPMFDIARTLAFLLVDCKHKPAPKVRKYFLQSGYIKHGQAPLKNLTIRTPQGEQDLLETLLNLFLLYDFYKFLYHNPYESLPQNQHFLRTRDILIDSGELGEL